MKNIALVIGLGVGALFILGNTAMAGPKPERGPRAAIAMCIVNDCVRGVLHDCLTESRDTFRTCREGAKEEFVPPAQEACGPDGQNRDTAACEEAVQDLREALKACQDEFKELRGDCNDDYKDCVEACRNPTPPPGT